MIHNIRIAARETLQYAMSQPDLIRVSIPRRTVLVDNLDVAYPNQILERQLRDLPRKRQLRPSFEPRETRQSPGGNPLSARYT